jgi:thiopeptide-type bacteriocin biosynthesis protein
VTDRPDMRWEGPDAPDEDRDALRILLRPEESEAASRKKVLLRLLARESADRRGLKLGTEEIAAVEASMRRRYGLSAERDLAAWLAHAGLDRSGFANLVSDVALVDRLEALLANEIEAVFPNHRAGRTIATWRDLPHWLQFDLELADGPGGRAHRAAAVFERIRPLLDPHTRPAVVQRFFLMRKPPGLRLRLAAGDTAELATHWREPLDALVTAGALARWARVAYEPEVFRLGGRAGCDLAHQWFEVDSLAWIRLEPAALRGELRLSRELLSLALLNDLFFATLDDAAEVWDVWCRLAGMHNLPLDASAERAPFVAIEAVLPLAGPVELELLAAYTRANQTLKEGLQATRQRGELQIGSRAFLATLALFHWNRFGLTPEARQRLVLPMLRTLDPHRARGSGGA